MEYSGLKSFTLLTGDLVDVKAPATLTRRKTRMDLSMLEVGR